MSLQVAHQKSNQHVMTLPSIPCKTTHYKPNGTGRDTYIKFFIYF